MTLYISKTRYHHLTNICYVPNFPKAVHEWHTKGHHFATCFAIYQTRFKIIINAIPRCHTLNNTMKMYNTQQIVHKHQPLQKGHQESKTARISNVLQPSLELCIAGREWQPGCAPLCNESIKYTSLGNVCKKNFAHCIKNVCSCRKFPTKKSKQSVDYQNFPFICTKKIFICCFLQTASKIWSLTYYCTSL